MVSSTTQQNQAFLPLPLHHSRCEVLQCLMGIRTDGRPTRGDVQMNATNRTVCIACPADTYSIATASVCTLLRERKRASERASEPVQSSKREHEGVRDGAGKHVWWARSRNRATDRCWAGGPKCERYGMWHYTASLSRDWRHDGIKLPAMRDLSSGWRLRHIGC